MEEQMTEEQMRQEQPRAQQQQQHPDYQSLERVSSACVPWTYSAPRQSRQYLDLT